MQRRSTRGWRSSGSPVSSLMGTILHHRVPVEPRITVASTRATYGWVSGDVVFAAEDALARQLSAPPPLELTSSQAVLRKALRRAPLRNRHAVGRALAMLRTRAGTRVGGALFASVIDCDDADLAGWFTPAGPTVLWLVDVWETDAGLARTLVASVDLLLLAYADAVRLVQGGLPDAMAARVHVFPLFLDPSGYPAAPLPKTVDLLQVGRADPRLHAWALRYSAERGCGYLYQRRSSRGIYYDDGPWDLPSVQLSTPRLRELTCSAKIALVSPPDRTNPVRTGRVSPLTPRYLEAALGYAVPVGSCPTGAEYSEAFPKGFTVEVSSYEEFTRACDLLLADTRQRGRRANDNRAYVIGNHGPEARADRLLGLLDRTAASCRSEAWR